MPISAGQRLPRIFSPAEHRAAITNCQWVLDRVAIHFCRQSGANFHRATGPIEAWRSSDGPVRPVDAGDLELDDLGGFS